jgi:FKBP-type peptidyl-prolyl cis-trans isomerase FkpA
MKKMFLAVAAIASFFFVSCDNNSPYPEYEQYGKCSYYKIHTKGDQNALVDTGGAIFVKIKFKSSKDSVFLDINEQTRKASFPMRLGSPRFAGDFLAALSMLHVGDSASFFVPLDSLHKYYPEEFTMEPKYDSMPYLGFTVRVDSMYTSAKLAELRKKIEAEQKIQEEMMQKVQAVMTPVHDSARAKEPELKKKDAQLLKPYLAANGFSAKPNEGGIYFKELSAGNGKTIMIGSQVSVMYTGKYLDGTIFDANTLVPGQDPMPFQLGMTPMVEGFTKGVMMMKEKGKAVIVVPSELGYKDGLTRVFEIEVVEVKSPDMSMMPPQQPRQ